MLQLVLMLLALALALAVAKLAFVLLILAGLIFRTKETASMLFLFAFLGLCGTHPWWAAGIVAVAIFGTVMKAKDRGRPPPEPPKPLE